MDFTIATFRFSARLLHGAQKKRGKNGRSENIAYKSGIFVCRDATERIGVESCNSASMSKLPVLPCRDKPLRCGIEGLLDYEDDISRPKGR